MSNPILNAFNQQFTEFLVDVRQVFPDNADILAAQKALTAIRKANPKLLCKMWLTHVAQPYANEIARGDVHFFLHKDYASDVNHVEKSDQIMDAIDNIRSTIHEMNESDMNMSMRYVQNLSKLAAAVK